MDKGASLDHRDEWVGQPRINHVAVAISMLFAISSAIKGATITENDYGANSCILLAAASSHLDGVRYLLSKGAHLEMGNEHGNNSSRII